MITCSQAGDNHKQGLLASKAGVGYLQQRKLWETGVIGAVEIMTEIGETETGTVQLG